MVKGGQEKCQESFLIKHSFVVLFFFFFFLQAIEKLESIEDRNQGS